ncbi:MAG: DUF1292 domain-containing protein [Clostridia bacterium]|nr:DUF1292 domain-containing protein [Clostridia bacterium]
MKDEKTTQTNEELDILDILLDEDNESPITLYNEENKPFKFDQVAVIPLDNNLYAILKPIDELEGVADDEAIVFAVNETDDGETSLVVEADESVAMRVFDEYYKLLDEQK